MVHSLKLPMDVQHTSTKSSSKEPRITKESVSTKEASSPKSHGKEPGSSSKPSKEVATTCDLCQLKTQAVADLLLLASDLRPVSSDALKIKGETFSQCQDIVVTRTKDISITINGLSSLLHSITAKWNDICERVAQMGELINALSECCSHSAYLYYPQPAKHHGRKSTPIVDKYIVCRASIDIDVACARLKHSSIDELTPQKLVKICSEISKNLSILTECCRQASESASESSDQEQFKLCVRTMTSSASCLLASIKSFKCKPCEVLHRRCIGFGEALTVATNALVNFAIEPGFVGVPVKGDQKIVRVQNSILGACMSTVSSYCQLCQTIRSLAHDNKNPRHRGRANLCLEALSKSIANLTDVMAEHGAEKRESSLGRASNRSSTSYADFEAT